MTTLDRVAYLLEDQRLMSAARRYFEWQARLVLPELGDRVLEVGCGTGNFTRFIPERKSVIAVDIEPACIDRLRQRFPHRTNLETLVGSPGDASFARVAGFRPDCCLCLNVIEHVTDDGAALRSIASVLTCGGILVLLVPAFQGLYGAVDVNLGHQRRYSAKALRDVIERAGFDTIKMHFMNSAGFFGWWVNARVLRRKAQSAAQIAFFDRYVVPLLARAESMCPPPFGQSLFAVAQKR